MVAFRHVIKFRGRKRDLLTGYPNLKIIMTSGFPGMRFNETKLANGLPLLSKPYRKQDLVRMVREVLDEPEATPGRVAVLHETDVSG